MAVGLTTKWLNMNNHGWNPWRNAEGKPEPRRGSTKTNKKYEYIHTIAVEFKVFN
jgi:hypothetical protein